MVHGARLKHSWGKLGLVGQLRFCLRGDVDPTSFGSWHVEEVRGHDPHASDVIVIAKRFMADFEPVRVICLMPALACVGLRACFQQPVGNVNRRAIGENLFKNITTRVPQCLKQGCMSEDAHAYLMGWVQGTLPKIPRPLKYQCLELRRYPIDLPAPAAVGWVRPGRFRVYTILPTDQEESDGEVDGRIELG